MATTGGRSLIGSAVSIAGFGLTTIGVAATVWLVTFVSGWMTIDPGFGLLVARAIVALLSRTRETTADRTAAAVTGSPAALAGALRTLDDRIAETPNRDLRDAASVSSLSILPLEPMTVDSSDGSSPVGSIRDRIDRLRVRLYRTHPPTERRLAELEALERDRY